MDPLDNRGVDPCLVYSHRPPILYLDSCILPPDCCARYFRFDVVEHERLSTMSLKYNACPRCWGPVELGRDLYGPHELCLDCGWAGETRTVTLKRQYNSNRIGTGKLPLSGWEREKRKRELEREQRGEEVLTG